MDKGKKEVKNIEINKSYMFKNKKGRKRRRIRLIRKAKVILRELQKEDLTKKEMTLEDYFNELIYIPIFEVPEKLELNDVLMKVTVSRIEAYKVNLLKRKTWGSDEYIFEKKISRNMKTSFEKISCQIIEKLNTYIDSGLLEIREFLLLIYYKAHCFKSENTGTITFSDLIKIRENKEYSINNIKFNADLTYDPNVENYIDYFPTTINPRYLKQLTKDELSYKSTYDKYEKKLNKLRVIIKYKNKSTSVPLYSRIRQIMYEKNLTKKVIIGYRNNNLKERLKLKIDKELKLYKPVLLPKAGIKDLIFIFDKLSNNTAFKRFQSGRFDLIKEKDLNELKEQTIDFFVKEKGNSIKEAKMKVDDIFRVPFFETRTEKFHFEIEKIIEETVKLFEDTLVDITYEYDLKGKRNELKDKEKKIIEEHLL